MHAFYFFFLATRPKTPSTLLNRSGKSKDPHLLLIFKRKDFSLSLVSMMLALICFQSLILFLFVQCAENHYFIFFSDILVVS